MRGWYSGCALAFQASETGSIPVPRSTFMVESPCVSICRLENDVCVGCKRTLQEVASWSRLSDEEKQQVLDRIVSSYVTLKKAAKTPTV